MVCHDCRRLFDAATHVRLPVTAKPKKPTGLLARRLPTLMAGDFKLALPDHIHASKVILNQKPTLPEPLLTRSNSRWVELVVQCPAGTTHRIESWKEPGRCPCCQAFLDKSFVPIAFGTEPI